MKFNMRKVFGNLHNDYMQVNVELDNTVVDLGLLDESECEELATTLREAADELWELDDDCTHPPNLLEISVDGIYCKNCGETFEDNTGSNLMGG